MSISYNIRPTDAERGEATSTNVRQQRSPTSIARDAFMTLRGGQGQSTLATPSYEIQPLLNFRTLQSNPLLLFAPRLWPFPNSRNSREAEPLRPRGLPGITPLAIGAGSSNQASNGEILENVSAHTHQAPDNVIHSSNPQPLRNTEPPGNDCPPGDNTWDGTSPESDIWKIYLEDAKKFDEALIGDWNRSIDVLLLFAALFSGILTAFAIQAYKGLNPDTGELTVALLQRMNQNLERGFGLNVTNSATQDAPTTFAPSSSIMRANCAWFASLSLSLGVTVVAMLAKQWMDNYDYKAVSGSTRDLARLRQYRYAGLQQWRVSEIMGLLPTLLILSLALFFWGLIEFLSTINTIVAIVTSVPIGLVAIFILFTTISPLLTPHCPYKSTLSSICGLVVVRTQHYCQLLWFLLSYVELLLWTEPEKARERYSATVALYRWKARTGAFVTDRYFSLSRFATRQLERRELDRSVSHIDAQAFLWLMNWSSIDAHVQAAIRASAGIMATSMNLSAFKKADVASVVEQQLSLILNTTAASLTDDTAFTAGACARIHCLLDHNFPSVAIAQSLMQPRTNSSTLERLMKHTDGNVACYFICASIRTMAWYSKQTKNYTIAVDVQQLHVELEDLLTRHIRRDVVIGPRALVMLFDTLNEHTIRGDAFKLTITPNIVEHAITLLSSNCSTPNDLTRAIIIMLKLRYERLLLSAQQLLMSRKASWRMSQLLPPLLASRPPEATTICLLNSISISQDMGEGSDASDWSRDGIYGALISALESGSDDRLCSAVIRVVDQLRHHGVAPPILKNGGMDESLAYTVHMYRSEEVWVDVCNCLMEISGRAERPYDEDLSLLCIERLFSTASDREVLAITLLLLRRSSLRAALLEREALSRLAQHIQGRDTQVVLRTFLPLASAILSGKSGEFEAATVISDSPLLAAVSGRLCQYKGNYNTDGVRYLLRCWSNVVGRLCLTSSCRDSVTLSGIMPALVHAWEESRGRGDRSIGSRPPWGKLTDQNEQLDMLAAMARKREDKYYFDWGQ